MHVAAKGNCKIKTGDLGFVFFGWEEEGVNGSTGVGVGGVGKEHSHIAQAEEGLRGALLELGELA